jgi:L-fucose isomerase-like protein
MGPSPWQNLDNPVDVNADGWTTPFDALLVINRVSEGVSLSALEVLSTSIFADVNGDRNLDATDAIHVINTLNVGPEGIGDAELSSDEAASRVAPLWYDDSRVDDAAAWQDGDWNQAEGDDANVELNPENAPRAVPRLAAEDESWDSDDEDLKESHAEDDDQLFSEDADWLLAELF